MPRSMGAIRSTYHRRDAPLRRRCDRSLIESLVKHIGIPSRVNSPSHGFQQDAQAPSGAVRLFEKRTRHPRILRLGRSQGGRESGMVAHTVHGLWGTHHN